MKDKLLVLAGTLALLAAIGKFYAVPAIAQTVRAALVQYRDSAPRQPLTFKTTIVPAIEPGRAIRFPAVPAGKRMLITAISGTVNINLPSTGSCTMAVTTSNGHESYEPLPLTSNFNAQGVNVYSAIFPFDLALNPGDTGTIGFACLQPFVSATTVFSGYYIDVP